MLRLSFLFCLSDSLTCCVACRTIFHSYLCRLFRSLVVNVDGNNRKYNIR